MSRAFVKEPDGETAGDDQPELPLSPHPNFVTQAGFAALEARRQALVAERRTLGAGRDNLASVSHLGQVERELRYVVARLGSAIVVPAADQPADEVAFGARVTLEDEDGQRSDYAIVGEDEADPAAGKVSWVSPLARAMMGGRLGDLVTWERPAGELELEITAIRYGKLSPNLDTE
jgi:transcription elongation GreA/GreB family factor